MAEKKLQKKHWDDLAELIYSEYKRRQQARKDLEKQWKDIDRQLRMEPDKSHKLDANGNPDVNKAWMPEMELPLQSQALEILVADSRRLRSAGTRAWFKPHSLVTDKYLEKVDLEGIIAGDENEVPSLITQDNVDKFVTGTMMHWQRQYPFHDHVDKIDAEAFKYGLGVGKGRLVTKKVFMHTAQGVVAQNQKIPVLFPVSIKNNYPDDRQFAMMNQGYMLSGFDIEFKTQLLEDLKSAAKNGSSDPKDEHGGWMSKQFNDVQGRKDGTVDVIEAEGDFTIVRSADTISLPSYIVTLVVGESNPKVVRVRRRNQPYSTRIYFPYHSEQLDTPYATSPLMKGRPIQIAAVDAMNRLGMVAALHSQPPVSYDKDNIDFASTGGPLIYPGAQWPEGTRMELVGDPTTMQAVYAYYLQQYEDVTGVNSPRLGAQTKSHTTAYAKDAELTRGTIRTVDYSRSCLAGPLAKWLTMAYDMGRQAMNSDTIYIDEYNGFVDIGKKHLPEKVIFEAFGAGAPAEEQQKMAERRAALQEAIQVDMMKAQMGGQPSLDLNAIQEQILREGGWTDIDEFFREEEVPGLPQQGSAMGATPGIVTQEPGEGQI